MKKKYVVAKTGEEANFGDMITCASEKRTSFGRITSIESIVITPASIGDLIEKGILKVVENEPVGVNKDSLDYYVKSLAKNLGLSFEACIELLEKLNSSYPKIVLDLLLFTISTEFAKEHPIFSKPVLKEYYTLRMKDGKVGKVPYVSKHIPLFDSPEDAERAREILKEQLNFMYGEQKNN